MVLTQLLTLVLCSLGNIEDLQPNPKPSKQACSQSSRWKLKLRSGVGSRGAALLAKLCIVALRVSFPGFVVYMCRVEMRHPDFLAFRSFEGFGELDASIEDLTFWGEILWLRRSSGRR